MLQIDHGRKRMTDDIDHWLEQLGLGKYARVFVENEIDLDTLPFITDEALEKIGVALGARLKILAAIASQSPQDLAADANLEYQAEPTPHRRDAERRQLTVMFCDLVGSTALSGSLDPEELRAVILAYQNAVVGEATRFEGHVARYMGDGVLIYFGWPRAHEDDAERAVRAALSMMQALSGLKAPNGETLASRIGIATGLVVVGDLIGEGAAQEEAVVGETPNLAARLQAVAMPGQVVISETTRGLLGELFDLDNLGEQDLKGISAPATAFSVLGARALESRYDARTAEADSPMVGREQELALLMERWRQARAGEGQMVVLTGEAGIGKSRITRVAIDAISQEPHFRINYQCSPYHGDSAFYPAIQQLSRAANFAPDDDPDGKLDKLEALLGQAVVDYRDIAPLLALMLGIESEARYGKLDLSPQQQRNRTLNALTDQLIGLAKQRPVLFIVEDAHWIDPTTLELIELCLDRAASAPVFLLITARPSFDHGFGGHAIVTRLALNRLGRDQIIAIVHRLGGGRQLPEELLDEIVVKTDGVPLFVEELTKAVLESGVTGIPASLHDSLMARLDRIPDVKEVAQIAAAIGRGFDYKLLMAIAERPEADLEHCLDKLTAAEIIFCRGKPPEASYTFKHALVRDAAYESVLKSRRQELHGKIAEVLETEFSATAEAQPELLAHHYTEAGLLLAASEKWLIAGERSARRAANREAIAQLRRGLGLLDKVEEGPIRLRLELDLLMTLGGCLRTLKGWHDEETVETVFRTRRLCDQMDDSPYRGEIGLGEYTVYLLRGELADAVECGRELLRLAEMDHSGVEPHIGHRAIGATLYHMGRFEEARYHLEAGLALYDPKTEAQIVHKIGYFSGVTFLSYLAHALWHFGYADKSLAYLERSISLTQKLQHPPSQAFALFQAAFHYSHSVRNDVEALRYAIERFLVLAQEGSFDTWSAFVNSQQACLAIETGDTTTTGAIDKALQNLEWWKGRAGVLVVPTFYETLARTQEALGRKEDALLSIDNAIEYSNKFGEQWCLAELYRRKGDLRSAAARDDAGAQEACYEKALVIAHDQSSRALELRAATSLAHLWAEAGDRRKAHDLLAPLYGWFSEGFDTVDLERAKAVLDETA
jgi:class 3 adenylate cyclase/tetratricopeptide (TPR) repeat protein